jgi:OOP family OmpA-OmpF porin
VRSKWVLFLMLALAVLVALPTPAKADISKFWLVPGGGALWPNSDWGDSLTSPVALWGGIVGLGLSRSVALEARGSFASVSTENASLYQGQDITLNHYEGNLTWFLTKTMFSPYLTGGAGAVDRTIDAYADSSISITGSQTDFAWNVGAGFRIGIASRISIRLDAREVFYPVVNVDAPHDTPTKGNLEAFGGLSFGFGGKQPDADMDGVQDSKDRCPDTPHGALVDANGCPLDGDGDGVFDGLDQCANTPHGATVDANGCPTDSDKDGVFDGLDKCPDTPAGATVDLAGCPMDSDGDGVYDGLDKCPNTPKGCTVDATGCSVDSDGDGVCDGLDKCPNTPTNVKVDATGCPIEVSVRETELLDTGLIRIQDINFDTGKANIHPDSYPILNDLGAIMTKWSQLQIEIGGYTDNTGSEAFNLKLSQARADSVLAYLEAHFPTLQPGQYSAKGYGESNPIASNATALGRAKNRRVEFKVLNKEALEKIKEQKQMVPKE